MIQPLEFKREYIHNNPSYTNQRTTLETMIDASFKYSPYDNTTYCTLYLIGLTAPDIKVLAKYADAGCGESAASSIDINFCPICGRKL